jgi:hypothetical protein
MKKGPIMNKSLLTLAAVATFASASFAMDADPSGQFAQQVDSSRTRAQVSAEAVAAVKAGETSPSKIPLIGKVQPKLTSSTTRADVTAQFLASRDEAEAMTAEDSGSVYLAKSTHVREVPHYVAGR